MMESQPFVLVELEDLSSVFTALKTTTRIKYTCFNVSNNYLIFGATSGGLYVFRREPCCFLQILPNKEGAVTQIAVSPDEKLIAFSTIKGLVCILEKSSHGGKLLVTTAEHQNDQVTCLQWNEGSNELYIGDKSGKVSVVTVSIFPTKSMFQNPSCVLMQLDSKIVQMDFNSNMLLVSTLTKCYICDTAKEIFRQVGHKLRDGEYGACIFNSEAVSSERDRNAENLYDLKLLCARPGSRIWEVAIDGTVISTHHFKKALAVPPKKIFFLNNSNQRIDLNGAHEQNNTVEQSFNFQKLFKISHKFFLTYKSNGLYIFDHQKASVVLWNNEITNITDVKCVNDVIYVWSGYGKMFVLNLVPLKNFLIRLYFQGKYVELANLCIEYESFLLARANDCGKFYILHDLDEKLTSDELRHRLTPVINLCKEIAQKRKNENLQSGARLMSNAHPSAPEDKTKYLRPSYLNLKVRSHSVSPERLQNGSSKHQGSCPSLPDLVKDESPTDIVVNGRNADVKLEPKIDTETILKSLDAIKQSPEPSSEAIFSLFRQILCSQSEADINLESVKSFPFNLYFSKSDVELIANLFYLVLSTKSLFEWLASCTGDWLSNAIQNYPDFLIENIPPDDLNLDYKMSKIVKLFARVLNEKDIVELIKKSDMKCYYATLCEILDIFHDSSVSSMNLVRVTSTPKLLNTVYFLMDAGQIEQCSKYAAKIDLRDVFYLTLKLEKASRPAGTSSDSIDVQSRTMFLSYLDKAPGSIGGCGDVLEKFIVSCASVVCDSARLRNCSCGFPDPGVKNSVAVFPSVGHALLEKNWPRNVRKCMEICGRVPYLWRYFIFMRWNEPLSALLPLLIQAGEIVELENRCEINETIVETIIQNLIKLKKGICLNCNKKLAAKDGVVSWAAFGSLCIKLLDAKATLKLFKKYSSRINSKELDQRFYQSLIFSAIMEKHSKGLRKNVVDLLAGRETDESARANVLSEKLSESLFGKTQSSEPRFKTANHKFHHWGTKVNFRDNCAVCSLPLETKVLISEAGLIVFKCAHVFHSACLRKVNLECPICRKKLQS